MPQAPSRPSNSPAAVDAIAGADEAVEPQEAARYIAAFTGELSSLAKRTGLDLLGYLLDMARLEADKQARSGRG